MGYLVRALPLRYIHTLNHCIKTSSQGLDVIGVSIDSEGSERMIQAFMKSYGMTYTVLRDPNNRFSHVFSTIGVPETFLVDRGGNIVYHWKGPFDPKSKDLELRVENALGILPNTPTNKNSPQHQTPAHNLNEKGQINNNNKVVGLAVAFAAGLLSFLSPCVLPLIPNYASFCYWCEYGRAYFIQSRQEAATTTTNYIFYLILSIPQTPSLTCKSSYYIAKRHSFHHRILTCIYITWWIDNDHWFNI